MSQQLNVLNEPLKPCCYQPLTGFFRNGFCQTGTQDHGKHIICVSVTSAFLDFSLSAGNDLSTPRPEYNFPGLKDGDRWCVCVLRWKEAYDAGVIAPIILESSHLECLNYVSLTVLKKASIPHPN